MKGRNLLILFAVTAVLIVLAVVSSREKAPPSISVVGKKLLPDLPLNDIAVVRVCSASQTATVKRVESGWVSVDSHNYPIDFDKLRRALLSLNDLKIGQAVTADDAVRDELRMYPPAATGKPTGTLVEFRGEDGAVLASLLLGEARRSRPDDNAGTQGGYPDGQYVSTDMGKTVLLVADSLAGFATDPNQWLDADLVNVGQYDIARVTLTDPEATALVISRPAEGGSFTVEGMAETEEADESKLNSIGSVLSWLRFDGVVDPTLGDAELGFERPARARYETKKGEIYTVLVGGPARDGQGRYVRLAAALAPPETPGQDPAVQEDEGGAEPEQPGAQEQQAEERRKLEENIADLNARWQGWTYIVSSSF